MIHRRKVPDTYIRCYWVCPECDKEIWVYPDFYTINGTPMCDCGEDMEYDSTTVDTEWIRDEVMRGTVPS